jgi:rod shape determining protein RodA
VIEYAGARAEAARPRRTARAEARSFVARLDWVLLAGVVGLVAYGLWAIAGITRFDVVGDENYHMVRQAIYAGVGFGGLLVALAIDPELYRRLGRLLYVALILLLLAVPILGTTVRGSTRWIDIGFFSFQPSEFGKLVLVLVLAGFLAERGKRVVEWRTMLIAVGLAAVPIVLVFRQPDFGTALVFVAALAAVLFVAGTRWSQLALLTTVATLAAVSLVWVLPSVGVDVLEPYQTRRLTAFANPDRASEAARYNVDQSIVAIGAGGLSGRGVQGSSQTNLAYLPEHATDFAFASLAEQRGFVGAAFLLCLYLLVLWRGIRAISVAGDPFSTFVAGGMVAALLFQIFINVGMTMGIAPVTGIPLPFVSAGGSSLIANLLAMGILLAIGARGRAHPRR